MTRAASERRIFFYFFATYTEMYKSAAILHIYTRDFFPIVARLIFAYVYTHGSRNEVNETNGKEWKIVRSVV